MSTTDPTPVFRKSSKSGGNGGNCVEVADVAGGHLVRDSKNPDGPVLAFGAEAFTAFVDDVKAGRLNRG